jgi:hypothetical protein
VKDGGAAVHAARRRGVAPDRAGRESRSYGRTGLPIAHWTGAVHLHDPGGAWPLRRERPLARDQLAGTIAGSCRESRRSRPASRPVGRVGDPSPRGVGAGPVIRRRGPFPCSLRMRFSTRYSMACYWWRLTHPARVTSSTSKEETSAVMGPSCRVPSRPVYRMPGPNIRTLRRSADPWARRRGGNHGCIACDGSALAQPSRQGARQGRAKR